jgi:hypothetical protein
LVLGIDAIGEIEETEAGLCEEGAFGVTVGGGEIDKVLVLVVVAVLGLLAVVVVFDVRKRIS